MELTWLADTPQSRSRTRALRACPACQRRKKRCRHLPPSSDILLGQFGPSRSHRILASTRSPSTPDRQRSFGQAPARAKSISTDLALSSFSSTERFVGDLNPEAVIRERLNESSDTPRRDRVGLWISSSEAQNADEKRERCQATVTDPFSALPCAPPFLDGQTIESILHQRYMSAVQTCSPLPDATRDPLTTIYFSKINRITPLVDQNTFIMAQRAGSTSTFLERAICLVAAKDQSASPHLRLVNDGPVLTSRQFCTTLYKGLVAAMDAELEPDRLTRVRVLALMSLHCEGYEGAEAASLHLCQAIHQAQTVGLHLDRPGRTSEDPLFRLFWCLWTLDKMHASIGGRPVLLADRDIGIEKPNMQAQGPHGAFGVWLAVSDLLATVISFYRPSAGVTNGWEEGFPAFEDIVGVNTHADLDFSTLGVLELYYHCVAILSCRYKLAESFDGSKVSSIRQGLAAVRICSIVASECVNNLPPLPIVPYAISLSMGVSYRQLRSSKLITHFDRARGSLEACCAMLEDLGPRWYSAEAMARLGRKALQHINHDHPAHRSVATSIEHPHIPADLPRLEGSDSTANSLDDLPSTLQGPSQIMSTVPSVVPGPEVPMGCPSPSENDVDSAMHGFADIDTLFGDFLDLSLPTNFWDPIFAEEEPPRVNLDDLSLKSMFVRLTMGSFLAPSSPFTCLGAILYIYTSSSPFAN
ncbi:hypothetical protein N7462_009856 [Penicillium macrosclerotiorum]|uniref:uncharacterized protein n=1 Tax=Penicillium macrosclerotiorum TaxID=303699 RepID=UPI002548DB23|nr:uncharacterized protein N7462_009856 [Penicillium macrosclerotiorum]KAJ5668786.1 hypothetical protein N7462_009856 [Penicillium macrosclerotiorum]